VQSISVKRRPVIIAEVADHALPAVHDGPGTNARPKIAERFANADTATPQTRGAVVQGWIPEDEATLILR